MRQPPPPSVDFFVAGTDEDGPPDEELPAAPDTGSWLRSPRWRRWRLPAGVLAAAVVVAGVIAAIASNPATPAPSASAARPAPSPTPSDRVVIDPRTGRVLLRVPPGPAVSAAEVRSLTRLCPADDSCVAGFDVPAGVRQTVLRSYPQATELRVTSLLELNDRSPARLVYRHLTARLGPADLDITLAPVAASAGTRTTYGLVQTAGGLRATQSGYVGGLGSNAVIDAPPGFRMDTGTLGLLASSTLLTSVS